MQAHADKPKVPANVTIPKGEYVTAVGRRKTATARVRIYKDAGDFIVNNKVVGDYFANVISAPTLYTQPFVLTDSQGKYAVIVKVDGSGINAQLDATIHGISRALVKLNPDFRLALKQSGLLSRDDRMRETRKIGTGGKARRAKQSPKR
ncbi:30S ribosomal protein S9 [Patescibacteria group bacterium]|nr:30S ribosomal protein S9 [Patescibacteria group bacterium]